MIAWGLISLEISDLLSIRHAALSVGMVFVDCKKCMGMPRPCGEQSGLLEGGFVSQSKLEIRDYRTSFSLSWRL